VKANAAIKEGRDLIGELKTLCRAFMAHDKGDDSLVNSVLAIWGASSKQFRAYNARPFHIPLALENGWASLGDNMQFPELGDPEPSFAAERMRTFEVRSIGRKRAELSNDTRTAMLAYVVERVALLKEAIAVIESMPSTNWRTQKLNGLRRYLKAMERLVELIKWN
jgi:hypothetical protein